MSASPLPPPSATFDSERNRTSLSDGGRKRRERSASSDEEEGEVKGKMEEKRGKGEQQGNTLVNNVYRVGHSFADSSPSWRSECKMFT